MPALGAGRGACLAAFLRGVLASEEASASSCNLLQPGQAHVVDDFLSEEELEGFARVLKGGQSADDRKYGTSFEEVETPTEELDFVWSVMRKMQTYAEANIKSQSQFKTGPWAFRGSYYPDLFALRRYGAMDPMKVHMDTGSYARCLSGELHLGDELAASSSLSASERGGHLQLYGCRGGCRPWHGWASRAAKGKQPPEDLGEAEDLELSQEVDHKPGRLVLFLAETPHGVSRVKPGAERNVLFVWFACEATLSSGAAALGHAGLVDLLLEGRASVHEPDAHGQRPLGHAATSGRVPIIRQLLARRADPAVSDSRGLRPLHVASVYGHLEAVEELLAGAGSSLTALTKEGDTPAAMAAMANKTSVLARLLDFRAAALEGASRGRPPLAMAIRAGHSRAVELLVAARADVDRLDAERGRPLFWAAWTGHEPIVERLLEGRAGPGAWSAYRDRRMLPLHIAAEAGHEAVTRLLIAAGAPHKERRFAAKLASNEGHRALAKLLAAP